MKAMKKKVDHMRASILLAGLLCMTGCYRFHDKPLSAEQSLDDFNRRSLDDAELVEWLGASAPGPGGWNLDGLARAAFFHNAELKEMHALEREAVGGQTAEAERPNPTVGVRPEYNTTTLSGSAVSPWILGLAVDVPIETMGKRAARMAQSDFRLQAAQLRVASTAWAIRERIRAALLDLYAARQGASILAERQRLLETGVDQFKKRLAAGDVSAIDLQAVTMAFEQGRNDVAENQRKQREALGRLAQAIGVPVGACAGLRFDLSGFDAEPPALPIPAARRMALLNRADLLAALAEYNAAQMALKLEVAKQYPDIQLGPGYTFDQSEDKWALGISLSLPLFNQNEGAIQSAEAKRDAAAAVFQQRQEAVAAEIEQAVQDVQSYLAQLATAEGQENQSASMLETTRRMIRLGELSEVDALESALLLSRAREALLQAQVNGLAAQGRLESAMQHPATMDDNVLNARSQENGDTK